MPPALGTWSLNHWTSKKSPDTIVLISDGKERSQGDVTAWGWGKGTAAVDQVVRGGTWC